MPRDTVVLRDQVRDDTPPSPPRPGQPLHYAGALCAEPQAGVLPRRGPCEGSVHRAHVRQPRVLQHKPDPTERGGRPARAGGVRRAGYRDGPRHEDLQQGVQSKWD